MMFFDVVSIKKPRLDNDTFEQIVVQRYREKYDVAATIEDVVQAYKSFDTRQRTELFSDKVNGRWCHVVDNLIGKQPFEFISYSKKHFQDITIPKYSSQKWPKDLLNNFKKQTEIEIADFFAEPRQTMKRSDFIKQLMRKHKIDQLPYQKEVFYNMCVYQMNKQKEERTKERGQTDFSALPSYPKTPKRQNRATLDDIKEMLKQISTID